MTKQRHAKDAADAFRLLRSFRSIRDRAVREHVIEVVEAMANDSTRTIDEKVESGDGRL